MEVLGKPIDEGLVACRLDALAARYRNAGGPMIRIMKTAGAQIEGLVERLPEGVRGNLDRGAERALKSAMAVASGSRGAIGDQPAWLTASAGTAMGAASGFGGLPASLVELPTTITLFLYAIQAVAAEHGFDPAEPGVQFDCIQIFAAPGPLERSNSGDAAFLIAQVALTGPAMHVLIARVAPRLAHVLGQKIAGQAIPVLGAAAGAAAQLCLCQLLS